MKILEKPEAMQKLSEGWRAEGLTVGLVPTMGALHDGHLSLIRRARAACDRVVVSIFVNPTQFGRGDDFETYSRPFERDSALLDEEGCDAIFAPTVEAMYGGSSLDLSPSGERAYVEAGGLGEIWEGEARPGHMRGVATVVAMLFNIARPHRAYFGEKDYQQLKVIERLVRNLFFGIEIVPCPTVREPDGLAMSSRNANLSPEERRAATVLQRALSAAANLKQQGRSNVADLVAAMREVYDTEPLVSVQYAAVVDAETLAPLDHLGDSPARAIIAARVGETRLIDNMEL
jgi:pantoate--beta-alanine ligase